MEAIGTKMISPAEEHKYLQSVNGIKDIAYYNIFEKYIMLNVKGPKKVMDIESSDQESLFQSLTGGFPIPGMIYTFLYKGEKLVVDIAQNKEEFFDHVPLVFCMNTGPGFFNGLNLNMFPPAVRLKFIQVFYETFKEFFSKIEELTDNNKLAWNKKFVEYMKGGEGRKLLKYFNTKESAKFHFAYRKYLLKDIKQFRMVEYGEWPYIPFYEPKNAFRGLNQAQMHKLYYRFKDI